MIGWPEALASVTRGRTPQELADVVDVTPQTARNWLAGRNIPGRVSWKALVVAAGMADDWAALSAARDAAENRRGPPILSERERLLRLRARVDSELEQLTQGADVPGGAS